MAISQAEQVTPPQKTSRQQHTQESTRKLQNHTDRTHPKSTHLTLCQLGHQQQSCEECWQKASVAAAAPHSKDLEYFPRQHLLELEAPVPVLMSRENQAHQSVNAISNTHTHSTAQHRRTVAQTQTPTTPRAVRPKQHAINAKAQT